MNRHKIWTFGAIVCLVGLGFSDTANGQITTSPPLSSGMGFQVQSGGAVSTQVLGITTAGGATTLVVTVPANQSWLTVAGNPSGTMFFPNSPASLNVTVNTSGFNSGAIVSTTISIAIYGEPSTQVAFPVTLTVGTPSLLSANPANLTFSAVQGSSSGSPNSIPVTITSSGEQLNYNVSASTTSGGSWILLTNTVGTTGNEGGFQVQVNPQNLVVGTYTGTVLVQSQTTGDSVSIMVTLTVTAGATLSVTGTLQNFIYQYQSGQGNFSAQQQTLMVSTSSGTSLNYSATVTTTGSTPGNTTNWLVLSATGGTATSTPQPLYLSLSYQYVASLSPGTYTLNLAIAPTAFSSAANTTNIAVTLVVSRNPLLQVNTNSLSFTVPFGSTTSQSQTVQVSSSSGTSIPYLVQSNVSWLVINPTSGSTTQNPVFSVYVNASGLSISNTPYTATILVLPNNSDYGLYSIPITVSVTVSGATSTIYAGPDTLLYSYETGVTQLPLGVQLVQLTSTSTLGFSVTTTTMAGSNCPTTNWLNATQSQSVTPATLSVSVAASGMTAGFCTGNVIVTYNNGTSANTTVIIPVTVDIAATSLLTVTPPFGFGVVTATSGSSALISSQISINSTDGSALRFSAFSSTPNAPTTWLFLGSSSGTTQQYLQVQISPSGLPVGTYTGSITINAATNTNLPSGALTIPVVLTVSANTTVTVSPTSLAFSQSQNATTLPAAQTISLTATGGSTTFTASVAPVTGGTWLQVTPLSGTATATAGTISASVLQNSLSPGTYTSNIVLTFQNAATPTVTVPVSLVVTTAQTVAVTPTSLSFSYQLGGSAPPTQTLNVTSTGGAVNLTAAATSTTGWLSVTPTTGETGASGTPQALTVTVTPTSFTAAGTYSGTITITATGQAAITVNVTVTVTGVPAPQPSTISNSASGAFGAVSPGELITIKGINLGPNTATSFSVGPGGTLSNTLAGVQVMFDTNPGTPIYVSASQINVIVPYEIAGRATTTVTVIYQNQQSAGISQLIASQAPGIYTFSATGAGQASVLNQNGTLNGPSTGLTIGGQFVSTTPASQGSVIAVFMTGGGQTNPASVTGTVTPTATLYKIPGTVTATINGVTALVEFAGAAPGLVTGVIQVNILVPTGVTGSGLPLSITINNSTTLSGPTVAVQ